MNQAQGYTAGYLSLFQFKSVRYDGVRLPFASARFGRRADDESGWTMPDAGAVFGMGRSDAALASSMYNDLSVATNGVGPAADRARANLGNAGIVNPSPGRPESVDPRPNRWTA